VTDSPDPASLIEAAQNAADAGDYSSAERLLREAATIQEASLGSSHPDLATTLNNLAFVCERTNNIAEAERGYRRAHAIAVASLGPRDPFVATSLKNLVGFCATHRIPIWKPPTVEPEPDAATPDAETAPEIETTSPDIDSAPESQHAPVLVIAASRRPLAIGAAVLAILIVAAVAFTSRREPQTPSSINAAVPSPASAAPAPAREVQPEVAAVPRPEPAPTRVERRTSRPTIATPQSVTVLNAQLCKTLARRGSPDWHCTSADGDLRPGTFFFYTRLLADLNTTIEHRWYRDERVHQVMRLRVAATPGTGYRTFSSNTVSAERAGEWRVEVRAADGTVLQEQRFVIHAP
jgi:hypothetical protein